jgi:hypothetical protein
MKPLFGILAGAFLALTAPVQAAGPLKETLKIDASTTKALAQRFGFYGYKGEGAITGEAAGFRFGLPEGVEGIQQTGIYSHFAVAGDCEISFSYELVPDLPVPTKGYGISVGLSLDAADGAKGSIQRVHRIGQGNNYLLNTSPPRANTKANTKAKSEEVLEPTSANWGRITVKRVKKELIVQVSHDPAETPKEFKPLPFTDANIRPVRFFVDPGGSPTEPAALPRPVEVRLWDIEVRAEEITGGVSQLEKPGFSWWPIAFLVVACSLLFWYWHARKRRLAETAGKS